MCREEKMISTSYKAAKYLFRNTEAALGGTEAVTGGLLQKKVFLKISQTSQENTFVDPFK